MNLLVLVLVAAFNVQQCAAQLDNDACCSTWFFTNNDFRNCSAAGPTHGDVVIYDIELVDGIHRDVYALELRLGYCFTEQLDNEYYDNMICPQQPVLGKCPYSPGYQNRMYSYIPFDPSVITFVTCASYNRWGYFCNECIDGFGPAAYSMELHCVHCYIDDDCVYANTAVLILINIIPTTLLFIILLLFKLIFDFSLTSGPLLLYVLFSQVVWFSARSMPYIHKQILSHLSSAAAVVHTFSIIFAGFWNLDYFRPLYEPICIGSGLSNSGVLALDYISVLCFICLVIPLLIIATLCCHNIRPFVTVCHYLTHNLNRVNGGYSGKATVMSVLTSFVLLSSSKCFYVLFNLLNITEVFDILDNVVDTVVVYDPTLTYLGKIHVIFSLAAFLVLFVLVIIPLGLLFFCSFNICTKCCTCYGRIRQLFLPFVETVAVVYKNGTQNRWNFQFVPSIVWSAYIFTFAFIPVAPLALSCIFYVSAFSFAVCRPCKSVVTTLISGLFLLWTATHNLILFLWMHNLAISSSILAVLYVIICVLPHVWFLFYLLYCILKRFHLVQRMCINAERHFQCNRGWLFEAARGTVQGDEENLQDNTLNSSPIALGEDMPSSSVASGTTTYGTV